MMSSQEVGSGSINSSKSPSPINTTTAATTTGTNVNQNGEHVRRNSNTPLMFQQQQQQQQDYSNIPTDFSEVVKEVRLAIQQGVYPTRISQGSSGSYFCRNRQGEIVAVFKPKNEEPYGQLNPKWTKWLHRTCCPCFFGRSCLIPNLGYISEAAASVVDQMLRLDIVPKTYIVHLASPTFSYSYLDKQSARRNGGQYPEKIGSFQLFVNGYMDASKFLREGPAMLRDGRLPRDAQTGGLSQSLQSMFQDQFERMVVLDYLIRNTDRGLDNWLVRYAEPELSSSHSTAGAAAPKNNGQNKSSKEDLLNNDNNNNSSEATMDASKGKDSITIGSDEAVRNYMGAEGDAKSTGYRSEIDEDDLVFVGVPKMYIAAIDNGLAFPFKHPDQWRSYPYGWSYLPAALVVFSQRTRESILPLLSSKEWWISLCGQLRHVFQLDSDFDEKMFMRQMAVIRGQIYNLSLILSGRLDNADSPSSPIHPGLTDGGMSSGNQSPLLLNKGSPMDLIALPPCMIWEDEDVRYLSSIGGREFKDGVFATIIGGIESFGRRHNQPVQIGDSSSLTPREFVGPDGKHVYFPHRNRPVESRRRVEEEIEEGRDELPQEIGVFLAPRVSPVSVTPRRPQNHNHQHHHNSPFKGRIITFVKSQPWFKSW